MVVPYGGSNFPSSSIRNTGYMTETAHEGFDVPGRSISQNTQLSHVGRDALGRTAANHRGDRKTASKRSSSYDKGAQLDNAAGLSSSAGLPSSVLNGSGLLPPEDFDYMVSDLRRVFVNWLRSSESNVKTAREALLSEMKKFEEEKNRRMKELEDMKILEYEKIRDERLKVEAEAASIMKQIALERDDSRKKIKDERKKLESDQNQQRRNIQMEQERLRREAEALDAERRRIVDNNIATESMVEINVGGTVFETSRHTVTQFPGSHLESLFAGRHTVKRDKNGRIFIDRDSELFRSILNYLRNPDAPPPAKDAVESELLCKEAQFYGVKFFPFPLVMAIGGNDGIDYLSSVEVLDIGQHCWRSCRSLETPRAHFSGGTMANKLYVCGGQNIDYRALCDVEVYDCLRDQWMSCAPLVTPRRNTAGAVMDDRLFCIGGFDGTSILSSVETYDPRMRNWMEIGRLTCPRSSPMVSVSGGHLYVMGGSKGERLRTVERFDPRMNVWESLNQDMIEVRSSGAGGSVLDFIFAIGGVDGGQRVHDSIEMAHPDLGDWHFRKALPTARMDHSCVVVEHSVVVSGGQCKGEILNTVDFYRPELDEWQSGPPLIGSRFGHLMLAATL